MVDSESGDCCGSFHSPAGAHRDVDRRARLDGYSVHSELKTVPTDPLPLHGTLLSRDDRTGARACFGCHSRWLLWMAFIGGSHSWRKHDHLVGHRKGVGKIFLAKRLVTYRLELVRAPTCLSRIIMSTLLSQVSSSARLARVAQRRRGS